MILGGMTPPPTLAPTSAQLGTFNGSNLQRNGNTVTATFTIPATAPSGPQTVPLQDLVAGNSRLGNRGDRRQHGYPGRPCHSERLDPALRDVRQ